MEMSLSRPSALFPDTCGLCASANGEQSFSAGISFPQWNSSSLCGSWLRWQSFPFVTVWIALWSWFSGIHLTKPPDLVQTDWLLQGSVVTFEVVTIHIAQGCCQGRSTFLLLTDGLDLVAFHSTKGSWVSAMFQAPWYVLGWGGGGDGRMNLALSLLSLDSQCTGQTCARKSLWCSPLMTHTQNCGPEFHFDKN